MFRFLFAILLCLSFLSGCGNREFIEHKPTTPTKVRVIHWKPYSEASFIASKSTKRAVLLYFERKDNPGSQLMRQNTLVDPEVVYFINENFVPIAIHGAQAKYKVKNFPTVLILASNNRTEIMRLERAMDGDELLNYLRLAVRINSLTETLDVMGMLNLDDFGLGPR